MAYALVLHIQNAAIVSTTFLLVVLLVAASSTLTAAIVTSVVAMLCFNFFFLPPVRTFTIADPQNWVALGAFLVVSVVASNLSARARARADEAQARRAELARLYDLSRDVLLTEDIARGHRRGRPGHCPALRPVVRGAGPARGGRHLGRRHRRGRSRCAASRPC